MYIMLEGPKVNIIKFKSKTTSTSLQGHIQELVLSCKPKAIVSQLTMEQGEKLELEELQGCLRQEKAEQCPSQSIV